MEPRLPAWIWRTFPSPCALELPKLVSVRTSSLSRPTCELSMCHFSSSKLSGTLCLSSLKVNLPFPDESFDLVRMSCLTMAIPFDSWESVLKDVCRVLTIGGRLELIDDHIFFSYGRAALTDASGARRNPSEGAPSLNVNFPSPRLSVNSSRDSHRAVAVAVQDAELYAMYGGDDAEPLSETTTLASPRLLKDGRPPPPRFGFSKPPSSRSPSVLEDSWVESAASSRDIELLFEDMMNMKFGIHLCPSEFILETLQRVFGHSREVETMHFTLAEPATSEGQDSLAVDGGTNHLHQAPGLMLWPSTFLPMSHAEVEAHTLKYNRLLLSCKTTLADYATEINGEDGVDDDDGDAVLEALWDYEK